MAPCNEEIVKFFLQKAVRHFVNFERHLRQEASKTRSEWTNLLSYLHTENSGAGVTFIKEVDPNAEPGTFFVSTKAGKVHGRLEMIIFTLQPFLFGSKK